MPSNDGLVYAKSPVMAIVLPLVNLSADATVAAPKLIEVLVTDVTLPLLSTANTGICVEEP